MSDFALPGLMPETSPKFEAIPTTLTLAPHRASSTSWIGIDTIGPITIEGVSPITTVARAWFEFRPRLHEADCPFVLDSDLDEVLIVDAETWLLSVAPQPLPLLPGLWDWKMFITDSAEVTDLYYEGSLLIRS